MVRTRSSYSQDRVRALQWTARIGAVTAEALAVRERCTLASARSRLSAAERDGQLSRRRPLAGEPALFTLTRAGLRASGLSGVEPCRITVANAPHAIACARAAAALERGYPDHLVLGERELRRDERLAGTALAHARLGTGPDGRPLTHRPDLVLWPDSSRGLPVAVEVELTIKSPRRLVEICRAWARCRHVAGVLYLAEAGVRRPLARAVAEAGAEQAIVVLALEAVADIAQTPAQAERTVPGDA